MAQTEPDAHLPVVVPPGRQIDLFIESSIAAPLRDDRVTMEFPFFALQKRPLLTPLLYQLGDSHFSLQSHLE